MKACSDFHLLNLAEDLKADFSKEYGPFLVFKRLFSDLGIEAILRKHFASSDTGFDVVEAVFNMMLNRIGDPSSKRQLPLWGQNVEGAQQFELHQYYRALDYLIEKKDDIEKDVFSQMRNLFNTELDCGVQVITSALVKCVAGLVFVL